MYQYYCVDCGNIDSYFREPQGFFRCSKCNGMVGSSGMFKYFSPSERLYVIDSINHEGVLGIIGKDTYRNKLLVVPEGTKTITHGFSDNPYIEEIRFPSTIREIQWASFRDCHNLKKIVFQRTSNCTIGSSAFADDNSLEEVVLAEGIVAIEGFAFSNCKNLKKVTLPKSLKTIEAYAFSDCNVELAVLPSASYGFDSKAFGYNTDKTKCFIKGNKPLGEREFAAGALRYYIKDRDCMLTNSSNIEGSLFGMSMRDYTKVDVPAGIKRIEPYAFAGEDIESIIFPRSLETIKEAAFYDCKKLASIRLNPGLQRIENNAFFASYSFETIKKLEIPSSVKFIGKDAFKGHKIEQIVFHEGIETIESGAFSECVQVDIDLPKTIKSLASDAFGDKKVISIDGVSVEANKLRSELNKRKDELISAVDRKKREIISKQGNIKTLETAIPVYEKSIENKSTEMAEVLLQIDNTNAVTQEICSNANKQIHAISENLSTLKKEKEAVAENREKAKTDLNNASIFSFSKKRMLTESIEQYEEDIQRLTEDIEEEENKVEVERAKITEANNNLSALKKRCDDLSDQIKNARSRIDGNKSEIELETRRIEQLEKDIEAAQSDISVIDQTIEDRVKEKNKELERRKLILEKERLIGSVSKPYYRLPFSLEKIKEHEAKNIEEESINKAFGEYAIINNTNIKKEVYKNTYSQNQEKIDRIIQINELLNCSKFDGISDFSVLDEIVQKNSIEVPERLLWLSSIFKKEESWKSLKKCKVLTGGRNSMLDQSIKEYFSGVECYTLADLDIMLFPYCMMFVREGGYLEFYYYKDIKIEYDFTEKEYKKPPKNLEIVSQHYLHENADGSPSRRYKDNPLMYLVRDSFLLIKYTDHLGKKRRQKVQVKTREQAEEFVGLYKAYTDALSVGTAGKLYKAVMDAKELDTLKELLLEEEKKEKSRLKEERKRIQEAKKLEEEKRLKAEKEKEEKRKALIEKQKKLNEERRAEQERERQRKRKIISMFEDEHEPEADLPDSTIRAEEDPNNAFFEIVGNNLISNNIFKITIKQNTDINSDQITLYYTDLEGQTISNKKKINNKNPEEETVIGFVLKDGIDFTEMKECILKIEVPSGLLAEISFRMNISFYSDF